MNIRYVDVHSHPHFKDFDKDRSEMFVQMKEQGVGTIAIGTDLKTSKQVAQLTQDFEPVLGASVGQHPTETGEFDKEEFRKLLKNKKENKIVAIGECGLDYFRMDGEDTKERARQKTLFEKQIQLAIEFSLPLMLHIRSSQGGTDAHDDAFDILKKYKQQYPALHLHMHFFTASIEVAQKFIELDASFGIPGVVTFASSVRKMVKELPVERILLESDAPYAAPVPHRGERNEPAFVIDTLKKIAQIKKISVEELSDTILKTTKHVFNRAF